ncbi:MAG TPA: Tm-1-like ATP-binding domain-containing protein [Planctomycetaceae bacterium]|nr:Tm-1-like ATP-binding domain-containing protein [Planctomycetaceae bacterium]
MPVYLVATLDTKGQELAFVRDQLYAAGVKTCVVDAGGLGTPQFAGDIARETVFAAAGTTLAEIQQKQDRGFAVSAAATGVAKIIEEHHAAGRVQGVLALGGSAGTTIGTTAMRALPLGVPKVMVSTLAAGQTRPFVGGKDIFLLNSVVDIAGLNRISRAVLFNAAGAMIGMVQQPAISPPQTDKPLIAATMFGVTTPCVEHARKLLEAAGYEVLVFHATGTGGEAMENLIADGLIAGVLDITTTELADELVGGVLSAGPTRLTAAGKRGVPQVISVGALDMVNFGPRPTVPEKFRDRLFYQHNANITLMRTTPDENRQLGEEVGHKAASAIGPTTILFPLRGVSAIDVTGKPFDDPTARTALLEGLRDTHGDVELLELDMHINDAVFAETCVQKLLAAIHSMR